MKRAICLILAVFFAFSLSGCNPTVPFTCQELTMQVPEGMTDVSQLKENAMFRFALESDTLFICGIRQDFLDIQDGKTMTLHDYTHQLLETYGLTETALHTEREDYIYIYFVQELAVGIREYACGVYRASDAFWLIQMDSAPGDFDEEYCLSYLDSVTFS